MKPCFFRPLLIVWVLLLLSLPGHADGPALTPEQLDLLDQKGYFTPNFKMAAHALIDTKKALDQTRQDTEKLKEQLPDLQQQIDAAQAKTAALQKELAKYQHPEDDDFAALRALMQDSSAKLEDRLAAAQAFVWAYPSNPHADEARQDIQTIQKELADQEQAAQTARAAEAVAQAKLLQRVQVRNLSLDEWKDFLRGKSQEDLLKYLGRPDTVQVDYWTYNSAFTVDPNTGQKVGLLISFNGTRVNGVAVGPSAP